MFVTRMSPDTELRIYHRQTGEYIGMVKVLRPKCEEGKAKLGLAFDKKVYEFRYEQRERVVTVNDHPGSFGDFEAEDCPYIPYEADNY